MNKDGVNLDTAANGFWGGQFLCYYDVHQWFLGRLIATTVSQ